MGILTDEQYLKDRKIEALEAKLADTQDIVVVFIITLVIAAGILLHKAYKDNYRNALKTSCEYLEREVKDHPKVRWVNYNIFNETCTVTTERKDGLEIYSDYTFKETELLREFFNKYGDVGE